MRRICCQMPAAVHGGGLVELLGDVLEPGHHDQEGERPALPHRDGQQREEAVVADEPEGMPVGESELVVEYVVDQAVVPLEHERPGDHCRVDGQRVRHQEQGPQEAAAGERLLHEDGRRRAEEPAQADRHEREDAGDPERVEQGLADGFVEVDGHVEVVEACPGSFPQSRR